MSTMKETSQARTAAEAAAGPTMPECGGGLQSVMSAFRVSLFQPLRGRRGVVLFFLTLLPVIIVLLSHCFAAVRGGGSRFFMEEMVTIYHYIELLIYIFLGCSVLGSDMESRILCYDLTCPVSRNAIVAGRYLTYLVCAYVLVLPSLCLAYVTTLGWYGPDPVFYYLPLLGATILSAVIGAIVYGAFFLCLSIYTRRSALVAMILAFCIEGFVANIPLKICTYSVLFHLRNVMFFATGETGFFPIPGMRENVPVGLWSSVLVLVVLWGVLTFLSLRAFNRKQFT